MSNTQRLRKLRSRAEALLDAFVGLRLNFALLKPLMGDLDRPIPHPKTDGLRSGLPALRTTLFAACVLDSVKLAWDEDPRTPSIRSIVASLEDGVLIASLRGETSSVAVIHSGDSEEHEEAMRRIEEWERERRDRNITEVYGRLKERWDSFDSLPSKHGFVTLRDKMISHLELRLVEGEYQPLDLDTLGVRRRDLQVVIASMENLVFDVTALVRDSHFAMPETARMFDNHGAKFWANFGLPASTG